jgi:predicted PurR-regulated permease PerM
MLYNNKRVTFDISYAAFLKTIVIVLLLLFLYLVRDLLLLMVVAIVIASGIDSWVDFLQKKKIPRWVSVIFTFLILVSLIVLIFSLLIPPIIDQVQQLAKILPQYFQILFEQFGRLKGVVGESAYENVKGVIGSFSEQLGDTTFNVYEAVSGIFGGIFSLIIVLVLSFYFTVEEDSLKKFIRSLIPLKHRAYVNDLVSRIQLQIGRWLRGQMFLGLVVGLLYYIGLSILGIKYALILAILGGLLEIIPYIGPIISAIPAVFIAFAQSPLLALLVIVLYIIVQQIENHLLVPKIMQRVVGLNPLVTILVVLVGAKIAGILGGVLAIPIATAFNVFLSDIFESKDKKDKEMLRKEICKVEPEEEKLSGRERKYKEKLREEVCEIKPEEKGKEEK